MRLKVNALFPGNDSLPISMHGVLTYVSLWGSRETEESIREICGVEECDEIEEGAWKVKFWWMTS